MAALETTNDVFGAFQLGIITLNEARAALSFSELPVAQPVVEGE